jgi:hypothetical protein
MTNTFYIKRDGVIFYPEKKKIKKIKKEKKGKEEKTYLNVNMK